MANLRKFIIVEFYSIRNFWWFDIKLFFKIPCDFPINKILWVSVVLYVFFIVINFIVKLTPIGTNFKSMMNQRFNKVNFVR